MSHLTKSDKTFSQYIAHKIIDPQKIEIFAEEVRKEGKTIATLNGSFDLLHPGHLEMIYQASQTADLLLVLLNTDASIKAYKSKDRPINSLDVRIQNMAALEMVDNVSWFNELDPREVLKKIRPNVHVNGGDYGQDCLEAEVVRQNGGEIHIIDLVPGYSSTHLIKKIQGLV